MKGLEQCILYYTIHDMMYVYISYTLYYAYTKYI